MIQNVLFFSKFFEHGQLVQQAYFFVFRFGRVLYNQMYNYVHWHNDVMNKIDRHNDNQNLEKTKY